MEFAIVVDAVVPRFLVMGYQLIVFHVARGCEGPVDLSPMVLELLYHSSCKLAGFREAVESHVVFFVGAIWSLVRV